MHYTLLNNDEYTTLYDRGGDSLVAFFATIRCYKKDVVYRKSGRKGTYGTLRHYTGLSINTIKAYIPMLLELGMCSVHDNGNIAVHSRNYNRKNLNSCTYNKIIPICVHSKFSLTKSSSYYVRIHSNLKSQEKGIKKKAERLKLHCKYTNNSINKKELKALRNLERRGLDETTLKNSYRSNSTLSNSTFSKIKGSNSKASGNYHKNKLIKMNLISQQRDFKLFKEGVFSKSDVSYLRNEFNINGLFLSPFGIVREVSPLISICNSRY